MRRHRSILTLLLAPVLLLALAACVSTRSNDSDAGDRPVPTPEPTETDVAEPDPTPQPDPTSPPDDGGNGEWYEELFTDKTYPETEIGEQILELAEDEAEYEELWEWFELDDADRPDVDWDSQIVLFAGAGESGGCPLIIESVNYDDEERFITIGVERDVPEDTMCTMDWTPRVFVVAFDTSHLGEGELRALLYDAEFDADVDPEDGIIIREE